MRLVADIGGTNARLALVSRGASRAEAIQSFRNEEFSSFEDVIAAFVPPDAPPPAELVIAMAGPVSGNTGRMTNLDWRIDGDTLSARFGGKPVRVINDLTALGYAALHLLPEQLAPVAPASVKDAPQRQALVVGIGTGFNVSPVIEANGTILCPAAEAGHTSLFGSLCDKLDSLIPSLSQQFPTVEALFSGRGRRKFLSLLTDRAVERATPYIASTGSPDNAVFDEALDTYATLIGMLLAELKIAYLPTDGVFLAGGIARSSLIGHRAELCRNALMQENPFVDLSPPVWIIDDDAAALTGCAMI